MTAKGESESESDEDEDEVGAAFSVVAVASTGGRVAVDVMVEEEEEEVVVVAALGAESTVTTVLDRVVDDVWAFSVLVSSGSIVIEESELDVVVVDDDGVFFSDVVVDELEGTSFSVTEELVAEEEVAVSTPAFPPVADCVVVISLGSIDDEDDDVVASPEGVTMTCFVDEGTVTVTTPPPPPPFPSVAEGLLSVEAVEGEEVCWLEEVSLVVVGITVTCTVNEGTVTVTAFPAPVALRSVEELIIAESVSSPDEVWLGFVEEVTVDDKKPVTLIVPLFAPVAPGVTETSVEVSEAELPVDVVAAALADPAVTELFACGWLATPVGPLPLRLSAVEVVEVCKDCPRAAAEGSADCSAGPVAEPVEDTGKGANPDGPNELVAEEPVLSCGNVEVKTEPVTLRPNVVPFEGCPVFEVAEVSVASALKVEDTFIEESCAVVEEVDDWKVVLESVGAESPIEAALLADGVAEEETGVLPLPTLPVRLDDTVAELVADGVVEMAGSRLVVEPWIGTTENGESSTRPTVEGPCDPVTELTI